MANDSSPVFIVGYPRSGTTLLFHVIMSAEDFAQYNFDETHFFSHFYKRYGSLENKKNLNHFLVDLLSSHWFKNSDIKEESFLKNIDSGKFQYGIFLKTFMDLLVAKQGKKRWVEKTPWHMLYIPEILETFPAAKFIHIIRDARDVAMSICKIGWARGLFKGYPRIVIAWKWHIMKVEKEFNDRKDKCLTLRYEDLVVKPEIVVKRINRFLGTNLDMELVNRSRIGVIGKSNTSYSEPIEGISRRPLERWREIMGPKDRAVVEYLVGDSLRKYGYPIELEKTLDVLTKAKLNCAQYMYGLAKNIRMRAFPLVRR